MPPTFASADIAALVTAFSPPTPTHHAPTLVRSLSGDGFFDSRKVLEHFRALFNAKSTSHLKVNDLPYLLGIKDAGWVLDLFDGPIRYSTDGKSIFTAPEFDQILRTIVVLTDRALVNLYSFADAQNVSRESIEQAVRDESTLRIFQDSGSRGPLHVSSVEYVQHVSTEIKQLIDDAGDEKIRFNEHLPGFPYFIIRQLMDDIVKSTGDLRGQIEESEDGMVYVPSGYELAAQQKQAESRAALTQQFVDSLNTQGFCMLPQHSRGEHVALESDIQSAWAAQLGQAIRPLVSFEAKDSTNIIFDQQTLNDTRTGIEKSLGSLITLDSSNTDPIIDLKVQRGLIKSASKPELVEKLLESSFRKEVDEMSRSIIAELSQAKFLEVQELFQHTIGAPLHLYAAGLVEDATLRQHQDTYLCDYFRTDILPQFAETIHQQKLPPSSKIRTKEVEKLIQQTSQCKSLSEVQTAISKYAKKEGFLEPLDLTLTQVKNKTLQQKIQAMQKMNRASDVLQNLIWILLAQTSEGLFMSAGKDTSRMLKQYQLVGDAAKGRQVEKWRDLIKAGKESREDVQEMREMAMRAVEEVVAVPDVAYRVEAEGSGSQG